jgi:hypothetical protein
MKITLSSKLPDLEYRSLAANCPLLIRNSLFPYPSKKYYFSKDVKDSLSWTIHIITYIFLWQLFILLSIVFVLAANIIIDQPSRLRIFVAHSQTCHVNKYDIRDV